jgi:serine/threonine protein kinase
MPKGDVWSLLQTYLEGLTQCHPFFFMTGDRDQLLALYRTANAQARLEQLLDTYYTPMLPPAALAFFKWGLQVDPHQRPSAAAVAAHPYMQGG